MRPETLDLIRTCAVSPLAIMEERWDALAIGLANGKDSPEAVRAALGIRTRDPLAGQSAVVVIPICGMITPRSSYWGTSCDQLVLQAEAAAANPAVKAIVFDVDSPGGFVSGVPEAAARLLRIRSEKPTIAVVNHLMASAAYWLGSAASTVVVTPSSLTGSIGVFSAHVEYAQMLEDVGIKVTVIRAGRFKAEGNPYEPLTDTARAHMQETVDSYYGRFIGGVAAHRGTTARAVASGYGQGRVLTAEEAVAADLADSVGTLDDVLIELGVDPAALNAARSAAIAAQEERERETAERSQEERKPKRRQLRQAAQTQVPAKVLTAEFVLSPAEAAQLETYEATELLAARVEAMAPGVGAIIADEDEAEDPEHMPPEDDPEHEDDPDDEDDEDDEPEASGGAPASDVLPDTNAAPQAEEGKTMSTDTVAPGGAGTVTIGADAMAADRQRASEVYRLCANKVSVEMAEQFVAQGTTVENVKAFLAATGKPENAPVRGAQPDISPKERKAYSVSRAILAAADNDWSHAGYERELAQETERLLGLNETGYKAQGGILIPTGIGMPVLPGRAWDGAAMPRAALETGGSNAGEHFVYTEPGSFIDLLRNRLVTAQMGATFLPGLQGNVSFPKQTGSSTFAWVAENPLSDQADSDATTGQVTLTPREGQTTTAFSRRLLAQGVINAEMFVRNDLMKGAVVGVDLAALHGAGGTTPTGLYSQTGVSPVAFGGVVSFAKVVEMETAIVADNADIGRMGYVTTPEIRGAAKTTEKATSTGQFIWTGGVTDGEMNGYRAMASNQLSKVLGTGTDEHGALFGVWEQLLIGEWGAIELVVDPYSKKKQALIEVTLHLIVDVACRYGEAFSKATGLVLVAAS
jgi:HK97 family phage major capsid protein